MPSLAGGIVEILSAIDLYVASIPSNQGSVSEGGERRLSDRMCACVCVCPYTCLPLKTI